MNQPTLFESASFATQQRRSASRPTTDTLGDRIAAATAPARHDCETQIAGARAVAGAVVRQRLMILADLEANGPSTREEICARTGLEQNAACGRLNQMEARTRAAKILNVTPLVKLAPFRRRSSHGVEVQVYEITQAGRDYLAAQETQR